MPTPEQILAEPSGRRLDCWVAERLGLPTDERMPLFSVDLRVAIELHRGRLAIPSYRSALVQICGTNPPPDVPTAEQICRAFLLAG